MHERSDPKFPFKYESRKIPNGWGLCRSPYELIAFQQLDRDNRVEKYEIEPFKIPYIDNGAEDFYIPDVKIYYINGTEEVIEIKSSAVRPDARDCAKIQYAERHLQKDNISFKIWVLANKGPKEVLTVEQRCAQKREP